MNWELTLALVALLMHAIALVIWLTLRSRVERWIWWTVGLGFAIMGAHRVGEVLHYEVFPQFSHITAILIAFVALSSVFQTRKFVDKRIKHDEALAAVHVRLEDLAKQVEAREPIAAQIAEIISDLRAQITFYEKQAENHKLPLFHK